MQTNTYSEFSTDTEFGDQPGGEDVRQKVEETASTLVDQAQQVATAQASTQKERAAETLDSVAKSLFESGTSLRESQPQIASIADQAASRVVDASAYLREHDLRDLVSEAEGFARREPLIFIGAAFALGFAAARFMKASAPQGGSTFETGSESFRSPRTLGSGYSAHEFTAGDSNGGGDYLSGSGDYQSGSADYPSESTDQR